MSVYHKMPMKKVNPLTPTSDQDRISPYNIKASDEINKNIN